MNTNLSERAMLVQLSISQWTAAREDQAITQEVAQTHNSDPRMGKYKKNLIDPDFLKPVKEAANTARTIHREETLPWKDDGSRILPAANWIDYTAKMRQARTEFENRVTAFIAHYPELKEQAKTALNGLYRESDYPTIYELGTKFAFQIDTDPLPTSADFRVDIADEAAEAIRAEIESRNNARIVEAQKELWQSLRDCVTAILEKTEQDRDNGKAQIFRDSLIGNLRQMIARVPKLNLTNDPHLDDLTAECAARLAVHDAETLRQSVTTRRKVAEEAKAILSKMDAITCAQ